MNRSCLLPFSTLVLACLLPLACAPTQDTPAIDESNPVPIAIENGSFEEPVPPPDSPDPENPYRESGIGASSNAWVTGGEPQAGDLPWYGRWTGLPDAAKDGSSAVWSSYALGGADNGFSQELVSLFESGQYVLSVWINGDARGLVSSAILGYDRGDNDYAPLGSGDLEAPYGFATGGSWQDAWVEQTLTVDVLPDDAAIGSPIWIRFTCEGAAGPRQPEDTDFYGSSVYWDSATLTYYEYLPQ